jgi:hypothetical protein
LNLQSTCKNQTTDGISAKKIAGEIHTGLQNTLSKPTQLYEISAGLKAVG